MLIRSALKLISISLLAKKLGDVPVAVWLAAPYDAAANIFSLIPLERTLSDILELNVPVYKIPNPDRALLNDGAVDMLVSFMTVQLAPTSTISM